MAKGGGRKLVLGRKGMSRRSQREAQLRGCKDNFLSRGILGILDVLLMVDISFLLELLWRWWRLGWQMRKMGMR